MLRRLRFDSLRSLNERIGEGGAQRADGIAPGSVVGSLHTKERQS